VQTIPGPLRHRYAWRKTGSAAPTNAPALSRRAGRYATIDAVTTATITSTDESKPPWPATSTNQKTPTGIQKKKNKPSPDYVFLCDFPVLPASVVAWDKVQQPSMTRFAADLASTGELRAEHTVDTAADVLWPATDVRSYDWLVRQRGRPPERFHRWYVDTVAAALLKTAELRPSTGSA
jgi:hypothetical protein